MNVLAYCERVRLLLHEADVCPDQGFDHLRDRLLAEMAVKMATDGHYVEARRFARGIAQRWRLPV